MLSLFFLINSTVLGWILTRFLLFREKQGYPLLLTSSFILGNFFSVWLVFLLSLILPLSKAIIITCIIILLLSAFYIFLYLKKLTLSQYSIKELLLLVIFFVFSSWFMYQTLSFKENGIILIGYNVYGDFEMHLPLIRSFSWGENIPPSPPFFPNQNLAYHFLFDFWAAILETLGSPLVFSVNCISILSFTFLLYLIYAFPQYLFGKRAITGIIAVILFLFNTSLGYLDALVKLQPGSVQDFLLKIWNINNYLSLNPFIASDKVSIIWNLNVYANQRHLVFGIALTIILLFYIRRLLQKEISYRQSAVAGIIWGLLPFWQSHVFFSLAFIFFVLMIIAPRIRKHIMVMLAAGFLLAIPQLLWLSKDVDSSLSINLGFLTYQPVTPVNFIGYWFYNLGFSFLTIPLGFLTAKKDLKILFLSFTGIFIAANLIQFNKEIFNNHKFFNVWIVLMNFYSAYFLSSLIRKKRYIVLFTPVFILIIFSGIIDFMVTKNESMIELKDYSADKHVSWIAKNTPPESIFLISQDEMYHPVRMAGRSTFQFQPRYAWAYGYRTNSRDLLASKMYKADNSLTVIHLLKDHGIDYVILPKYAYTNLSKPLNINHTFYETNFPNVFEDQYIKIVKIE